MSGRNTILLISLFLGVYSLLIVPVYFALPIYNILDLQHFKRAADPIYFGEVILFAGESPILVLTFLFVVPFLVLQSSKIAVLAIVTINILFITLELYATLFPGPPFFERVEGCTLITCGMDHTLFHLSHLPFNVSMIFFSLKIRSMNLLRGGPHRTR